MERKATCCCGQLAIQVSGEPALYGICHCDNCKRRTGSAFGMSAYFEDTQGAMVSGKSEVSEIHGENEQVRSFCPDCGTTLFWKIASSPGQTGIAAGCFTADPLPEPRLTVSTEDKYEWLSLPEDWATSIEDR